MRKHLQKTWALMTALLLVACGTLPERNSALEDARTVYKAAQQDPQVLRLAPGELTRATEALRRAEAAWTDRAGAEQVGQLAYLAMMRSAIATEAARSRAIESSVAAAAQERSRLQQAARERETARERAASVVQQQEQLQSLQGVNTSRGMVVTLADVSFANGQPSLNADGRLAVQKLAEFMSRYRTRKVAIESFSDYAGSVRDSQDFSERRADAVRRVLLEAGINADRIVARAYGREFPIATNETAAGRAWNRRVEIIISDENGNIAAR